MKKELKGETTTVRFTMTQKKMIETIQEEKGLASRQAVLDVAVLEMYKRLPAQKK